MAEIKHVGRVTTTKKKCIVAYRTLPGDSHYCLIVPTENLPDSYHDSIINLVESNAGQTAYEFAEAMMRTTLPDGSNMLAALHTQGRLIKAPTSQIEMTPTTSTSILLSELNQLIAEQRGVPIDQLALRPSTQEETRRERDLGEPSIAEKSAPEVAKSEEVNFDSAESEAKYYRSQADKLAKQAAEFRRKAEELVPTKKPVK